MFILIKIVYTSMTSRKQINEFSFLNSKLENISKFQSRLISKICSGDKVIDLLLHKPYNYIDRSRSLFDAEVGKPITFIAKVYKHQSPTFNREPYKILVKSEDKYIFIVFFNYSVRYLYKSFPIGAYVIISGKLDKTNERLQIVHPEYVSNNIKKFKEVACIEPIYQICRGITNRSIKNIIDNNLKELPNISEWIDNTLIKKKKWLSWKESITILHKPRSLSEIEVCRKRLAYDELLAYQLALKLSRVVEHKKKERKGLTFCNKYREQVLSELSFQLTKDQIQAINEISKRQKSKYRTISLLQGDVGSGKTIVALFAMLSVVENSMQAVLMVPTAILAYQHYSWIEEALSYTKIRIALLTSNTRNKERRTIIDELASGTLSIVIGTHALLQSNIIFRNLGLIVIDEQQRFGVIQRNHLIEKGWSTGADVLFVTATPIPRTLQQMIYGDIKCSILREKPRSRLPVKTVLISIKNTSNVIEKLKNAVSRGEKAYWICPYIEKSKELNIAAAKIRFYELQKLFSNKVGIMHGKLTQKQKDQAISLFKEDKFSILVATNMIEVGVDIPDATIIVIENAEQFGLSQLHQLRGRVGRGSKASFCVLLYNNLSKNSFLKLKILCESQDGFYIAKKDMMIRGSGDLLGIKQSGYIKFKFADLYKDRELFKLAYKNAKVAVIQDKPFDLLLDIFKYKSKLHFSKFTKALPV